MKTTHRLNQAAAMAAAFCLACEVRADILYELEPGSTITLWQAPGVTEALTGTFSWRLGYTEPNFAAMWETSLTFSSASFSLTLEPTNNMGTSLFPSNNGLLFGAIVDCPALSPSPLLATSYFGGGSYEGPAENPTRVICPGVLLAPVGGGLFVAELSFTALQVPEPSTVGLLTLGLAAIGRGAVPGSAPLNFGYSHEHGARRLDGAEQSHSEQVRLAI